VPHQFVKAVGDIFIVSRASLPISEELEEEAGEVREVGVEEGETA